MPYLTCPNCGLTLAVLGSGPEIDNCPRCRARHGSVVEMMARRRPNAEHGPQRTTQAPGAPVHAAPPVQAPQATPGGDHPTG